jgi:uncharacterized membrane protein
MRNVVWFLAIVGVLFSVAVQIESSAERKVSADMMNITEMQTVVNKNMPTTVIKDPL